jgi:hypothetical protein
VSARQYESHINALLIAKEGDSIMRACWVLLLVRSRVRARLGVTPFIGEA